jgi:CHAD domain-containing protein
MSAGSRSRRAPLGEFQAETAADTLLGHLRDHPGLVPVGAAVVHRRYLDTFDWRLHDAGLVLEAETTTEASGTRARRTSRVARREPGTTLVLRRQHDGSVAATAQVDAFEVEVPPDPDRRDLDDGAEVLPTGRLRAEVEPLLSLRALLVRAEVVVRRHDLGFHDAQDKTVARLTVEEAEVVGADHTPRPRVVIEAVRGYDRAAERLAAALADALPLAPAASTRADEAFESAGCRPGDYSAKLQVDLEPHEPAAVASVRMLTHLLVAMERNEPGLRVDRDTEFLHDFRVTARRSRSLLRVARRVFGRDTLAPFEAALARVAAATGDARDIDVHLLGFDATVEALPAEWRGELEPMRSFLVTHRRQARDEVLAMLDGPDWDMLRTRWRTWLAAAAAPTGPDTAEPELTAAGLGAWAVRRAHHRLVRDGRRVTDDSPVQALHELRKRAKVLRYVLEAFGPVLGDQVPDREGDGDVEVAIRELKDLQDVLGAFQDADVQIAALRRFARQMDDQALGGPDTFLAMGLCLSGHIDDKERIRSRFGEAFERFDSKANAQLYAALAAPVAGGSDAP